MAVGVLLVSAFAFASSSYAQQGQARATTDLNVRSGPGTSYSVVFVLPRNAVVNVLDCTAGPAWCQVSYQNRAGWASATYLAFTTGQQPGYVPPPQQTPQPTPLPQTGAVQAQATVALNMRTGPGTSYPAVGSIPAGAVATLTRCVPGYSWCEAQYGGRTGWVSAQYLRSVAPQYSQQPINNVGGQLGLQLFQFIAGAITGQQPQPPQPPQPQVPGANQVCFYSEPGFFGQSFCVRMGQSDANIAPPWNDNISSLRFGAGAIVEVCADNNFGGVCRTYNQNIQQLPTNLDNRISSYRTTGIGQPGPGPGPIPGPGPGPTPIGQVCFYTDFNFQGGSFCLGRDQGISQLADWSDRISSIRVDPGLSVQVCENDNYGGWCEQYTNSVAQLPPLRNDMISSVRVR